MSSFSGYPSVFDGYTCASRSPERGPLAPAREKTTTFAALSEFEGYTRLRRSPERARILPMRFWFLAALVSWGLVLLLLSQLGCQHPSVTLENLAGVFARPKTLAPPGGCSEL